MLLHFVINICTLDVFSHELEVPGFSIFPLFLILSDLIRPNLLLFFFLLITIVGFLCPHRSLWNKGRERYGQRKEGGREEEGDRDRHRDRETEEQREKERERDTETETVRQTQ